MCGWRVADSAEYRQYLQGLLNAVILGLFKIAVFHVLSTYGVLLTAPIKASNCRGLQSTAPLGLFILVCMAVAAICISNVLLTVLIVGNMYYGRFSAGLFSLIEQLSIVAAAELMLK